MILRLGLVLVPITALLTIAATASPASADTDLRLDYKTESHDTVMTAPLQGAYLGASHSLGSAPLNPRLYLAAGFLYGLESTGIAAEAGTSLSYYAQAASRQGFGLTLDLGLSLLDLEQGHDHEQLWAGAVIAEPGLVFTSGRVSVVAGLRGKNVVYERFTAEDTGMTTTELFTWNPELGVKAGLRVAF